MYQGVWNSYTTFNPVKNGKHARVASLEEMHELDRAYESNPANYDGEVKKQEMAFAEGEARRAEQLESRADHEATFPPNDNPISSSVVDDPLPHLSALRLQGGTGRQALGARGAQR